MPILATAQGFLNDTSRFQPSAAMMFYENKGQLITNLGDSIPRIKYYTEHGFEKLYFGTDGVHFAYTKFANRPDSSFTGTDSANIVDSFYRLDMSFMCDPEIFSTCGNLSATDTGNDHLNFYLPQCKNGIEHVKGYKLVHYQDAFPGINVHFTSNQHQILTYIEITPNANPGDIRLHFAGQDSLAINGYGNLIAYAQNNSTTIQHLRAYTYDAAGNVTQMPWAPQFQIDPNGDVVLLLGSYSSSETLILRTIDEYIPTPLYEDEPSDRWATYYDDAGISRGSVIKTESIGQTENGETTPANMLIYTGQMEFSSTFPAYNGTSVVPSYYGNRHMYFSQFNGYNVRKWATYYGGPIWNPETITGMALAPNSFYAVGSCVGCILKNTGAFFNNNGDGWVGEFNKYFGSLNWATQVSGSVAGVPNAPNGIRNTGIDYNNGNLYIVGNAAKPVLTDTWTPTLPNGTGRFPMVQSGSNYFWPLHPGTDIGFGAFIMQFNAATKDLVWSTFIGGGLDLYAVKKGNSGIYIGGAAKNLNQSNTITSSAKTSAVHSNAPLVKPNSSAFFSDVRTCTSPINGPCTYDGYIGFFDNNNQLAWASYFGGNGEDVISALDINAQDECWVVGSTTTLNTTNGSFPSASSLASGLFPTYSGALSGHGFTASYSGGNTDDFVARFGSNHSLKWCSLFGGPGAEGDPRFVNHSSSAKYSHTNTIFDYLPYTSIAVDGLNNVIIGGSTRKPAALPSINTIPVLPSAPSISGMWHQALNASSGENVQGSDAYYALFNDKNDLVWSQHFGGSGVNSLEPGEPTRADERCEGIALFGGQRIYTIISSFSQRTPVSCPIVPPGYTPYCDLTYHGNGDVVIGFFPYTSIYGANPASVSPKMGAASNALRAKPNPVKNSVTASFILQHNELVLLQVNNSLGQSIIQYNIAALAGVNSFVIPMQQLSTGIYYITLKTATHHESVKLLKD